MRQPGIADAGAFEVQLLQRLEVLDRREAGIGDFGSGEVQPNDVGELRHQFQMLVRHLLIGQMQRDVQPGVVLGDLHDVAADRPQLLDDLRIGFGGGIVRDGKSGQQPQAQQCECSSNHDRSPHPRQVRQAGAVALAHADDSGAEERYNRGGVGGQGAGIRGTTTTGRDRLHSSPLTWGRLPSLPPLQSPQGSSFRGKGAGIGRRTSIPRRECRRHSPFHAETAGQTMT